MCTWSTVEAAVNASLVNKDLSVRRMPSLAGVGPVHKPIRKDLDPILTSTCVEVLPIFIYWGGGELSPYPTATCAHWKTAPGQ